MLSAVACTLTAPPPNWSAPGTNCGSLLSDCSIAIEDVFFMSSEVTVTIGLCDV